MKRRKIMKRKMSIIAIAMAMTLSITACSNGTIASTSASSAVSESGLDAVFTPTPENNANQQENNKNISADTTKTTSSNTESASINSTTSLVTPYTSLNTSDMFTDRDKDASYDKNVVNIKLSGNTAEISGDGAEANGGIVTIKKEGTYIVTGKLTGQIRVEADENAKVQIVLDNAEITNDDSACILALTADKVFVTSKEGSSNKLSDTGAEYKQDNEDYTVDGVIFSRTDLTLNGAGTLEINAAYKHGVVGKDDVIITDGTYHITAANKGITANDSVRIFDGSFNINSKDDCIHTSNREEAGKGYVYIENGDFELSTEDDGIHAETALVIKNGSIDIKKSKEGLEGATVDIENGNINIKASDDGINAAISTAEKNENKQMTTPQNNAQKTTGENQTKSEEDNSDNKQETNNKEKMNSEKQTENNDESQINVSTENGSGNQNVQNEQGVKKQKKVQRPNGKKGEKRKKSSSDSSNTAQSVDLSSDTTTETIQDMDNNIDLPQAAPNEISADQNSQNNQAVLPKNAPQNGENMQAPPNRDMQPPKNGMTQTPPDSAETQQGEQGVEQGANNMNKNGIHGGMKGFGEMDAQPDTYIRISGGTMFVDTDGDAIDSNGMIYIDGGNVTVEGPTNNGNGALDYGTGAEVNGGTVIMTGSSGMAASFSETSKQHSIMCNFDSILPSGTEVTLKDKSGKTILSVTPGKDFQSVIFSSEEIKNGDYTVQAGNETKQVNTEKTSTTIGNTAIQEHSVVGSPGLVRERK